MENVQNFQKRAGFKLISKGFSADGLQLLSATVFIGRSFASCF